MKIIVALLVVFSVHFVSFGQTMVKLTDVKDHVGDSVMIEGKVKRVHYQRDVEGSPSFFDFGGAFPNQKLRVVIWGVDRSKFTVMPEDVFKNKRLRVTGRVSELDGKLQMVVSHPDQIVVLAKE